MLLENTDKKIALIRGTGIGDVLSIINLLPATKKLYFDYEIDFFTFCLELEPILKAAGISNVYDFSLIDEKEQEYQNVFWLIGHTQGTEDKVHPHINPKTSHFLDFVSHELYLNIDFRTQPKIDLGLTPILENNNYITIHPFTGGSIYREWFLDRWQQVIDNFPNEHFIQIGLPEDKKLKNCDTSYMNISLVDSIRLIGNAKLHLGGDTFSDHATFLTKTPGIILWGATRPVNSGYDQNINIYLNLPCSPCYKENPLSEAIQNDEELHDFVQTVVGLPYYEPCNNPPNQTRENPCHKCMTGITVQMVIEIIKHKLTSLQ